MDLPTLVSRIYKAGTLTAAKRAVGAKALRKAKQIGAIVMVDRKILITEVGYLLIRAVTSSEVSEALAMRYYLEERERI